MYEFFFDEKLLRYEAAHLDYASLGCEENDCQVNPRRSERCCLSDGTAFSAAAASAGAERNHSDKLVDARAKTP